MTQMVRTQIYLPRELHDALKQRAAREGVTMAEQIREAVSVYVAVGRTGDKVLREDDPIWRFVGAGEGPVDASEAHDTHLYRDEVGP